MSYFMYSINSIFNVFFNKLACIIQLTQIFLYMLGCLKENGNRDHNKTDHGTGFTVIYH